MATVRIEAELSTDKLLEAVKQLSLPELDSFIEQVLAFQAKRKAPGLSGDETALLMKINDGLPTKVQQRYRELIKIRQEERLTPDEHEELLRLSNEVERKQVERLEALSELARIRGKSLRELMDALGIKPPTVV
jgi:hypothetical protein